VIQWALVFKRNRFKLRWPLPKRQTAGLVGPGSRTLVLGERTLVMGVLNVTPDSFSDGGEYLDCAQAVARAFEIERAGADILDIGGQSTRPGSVGISAQEEIGRLIPVLEKLRGRLGIPVSIDTSKAEVAEAAILEGAEMINDVTGLRADRGLAAVAAKGKLPLILMHMRGEPSTMQTKPFARDVMRDVTTGLRESVAAARQAGVAPSQIILDPGIGFGKSTRQNFELLSRLPELARLGFPLLVGTSRKGFIGQALGGAAKQERAWGTAATITASILGGAHIVRLHDVAEMVQVARVADAIANPASIAPRK